MTNDQNFVRQIVAMCHIMTKTSKNYMDMTLMSIKIAETSILT